MISWAEKFRCGQKKLLANLTETAECKPHTAINCCFYSWRLYHNNLSNKEQPLQQLQTLIHDKFIHVLTGSGHLNDTTLICLSLSCRLGGLNLINPVLHLPNQYKTSQCACSPLINHYLTVSNSFDFISVSAEQQEIRSTISYIGTLKKLHYLCRKSKSSAWFHHSVQFESVYGKRGL